jgi:hypothetical protein
VLCILTLRTRVVRIHFDRPIALTSVCKYAKKVAQDMGALNYPIFLRNLYRLDVKMTTDHRLISTEPVPCEENSGEMKLRAVLHNEYTQVGQPRSLCTRVRNQSQS